MLCYATCIPPSHSLQETYASFDGGCEFCIRIYRARGGDENVERGGIEFFDDFVIWIEDVRMKGLEKVMVVANF